MGLHRAGFKVTGVDFKRQPRYPFDFVRADALLPPFRLSDFALIWASPPCQAFTTLRHMPNGREHPNLIPPTREMLRASGVPYIIENVPGAPLIRPLKLCGTMFGLGTADGRAELRRHRLFETSFDCLLAPPCNHRTYACGVYGDGNGRYYRRTPRTVGVYGHAGGSSAREKAQQFLTRERGEAMGIDWMTGNELSQAIPPDYSEFIARAFLASGGAK